MFCEPYPHRRAPSSRSSRCRRDGTCAALARFSKLVLTRPDSLGFVRLRKLTLDFSVQRSQLSTLCLFHMVLIEFFLWVLISIRTLLVAGSALLLVGCLPRIFSGEDGGYCGGISTTGCVFTCCWRLDAFIAVQLGLLRHLVGASILLASTVSWSSALRGSHPSRLHLLAHAPCPLHMPSRLHRIPPGAAPST